jgi:protocatechuate 4,5-dioxygenase alpha chain
VTAQTNWVSDMPSQEAYELNRLLYRVQHSREEEKRFFADRGAYIAEYPKLTPAAAEALKATDIGQLYLLGANPYLLRAYCLQLRMPEDEYLGALRSLSDKERFNG